MVGYEPRTVDGIENKDKILEALSERSLTFGELLEITELPKGTLGRHLKKLLRYRQILKVYDYDREKTVYSANRKTVINQMILPELMRYVGADLVYQMFSKLDKGEKVLKMIYDIDEKGRPLERGYYLETIFNKMIKEKYFIDEKEDITPQEILIEIESNPEMMKHIRYIKDEKFWETINFS